jgi:hypothetical protein
MTKEELAKRLKEINKEADKIIENLVYIECLECPKWLDNEPIQVKEICRCLRNQVTREEITNNEILEVTKQAALERITIFE